MLGIAVASTTTLRNLRARVHQVVFVLVAIVVAAPMVNVRAQAPAITITDLGTLGGSQSEAKAVDADGRVVGASWTAGDAAQHAFLWTATSGMFDLGTLGGTSSVATAISGVTVVGTSWTTGNVAQHAFMWTAAAGMRDLGTLGGTSSAATAVSASGTVVGRSAIAGDAAQHAFAWTAAGGMLDLETLGGASSAAASVNASGAVVGASTITGDIVQHAFIWTPAWGMVDAGTLGGLSSSAAAVNASSVMVGASAIAGDVAQHGFIWTAGSMVDLGTLGGLSSAATAVNRIGSAVGVSAIADNVIQHAFIWTAAAGMVDLGTLGGPSSTATGMNDVGQVVGYSDLADRPPSQTHHAVLWQVGPTTTTLTVATVPGVFGGTTSLQATLSSTSGPVSGASVIFSLRGTGVGAGMTDSNGVATLVNVPLVGLTAGAYPGGVGAFFAGTPNKLTSSTTADLIISQAVPTVSWSNPQRIVYGTPLSATQLNATASVPGAFVYSPRAGTVLSVGPTQALSVTFTPADTVNQSTVTAAVVLSVVPATPNLTLAHNVFPYRMVEATGSDSLVSWTAPVATDAMSRTLPVACSPRTGSLFSLGSTTVACSAADAVGNAVTATFAVTVRDTTPPTVAVPDHMTAEASGPAGAIVTYIILATDVVSRVVPAVCVPESGGTFPYGATSVNCTATDNSGNSTTKSFSVTVRDTTPPTLLLPSATRVEATGATGAAVSFAASAVDAVDGTVPVDCVPASGTVLAIATTTVTCSAVDQHGNATSGSFKVTVRDTTPPTITGLRGDLAVEATGPDGARASWTVPVGSDTVSGSLPAPCAPASGTTFPLGPTTVTCSSADAAGNAVTATFVVKVLDTTPPNLFGIPHDLTLGSISPNGTPANWTMPTAADTVDGPLAVVCSTASGSAFALGSTIVTCSATDAHGNRATAKFNVTVQDPTPPVILPVVTGPMGTNGWYVGDVNITWSVTDLESSISAQTGCDPVAATTDTVSATFTCQATSAGGTASKAIAIKIDRSAPTLTFNPATPPPNGSGWNHVGVAVSFAATDAGSGVTDTSAASPLMLAAEGIGMRGTVTATDAAGNTATFTTPPVNIDWTPPSISALRAPAANGNGWNNSPVTVWFECADTLSGLVAGNPAPRVVSTQSARQSVTGTCTGSCRQLCFTDRGRHQHRPHAAFAHGAGQSDRSANQYGWCDRGLCRTGDRRCG